MEKTRRQTRTKVLGKYSWRRRIGAWPHRTGTQSDRHYENAVPLHKAKGRTKNLEREKKQPCLEEQGQPRGVEVDRGGRGVRHEESPGTWEMGSEKEKGTV